MTAHKFKVGERVTMVNDYGAEFPGKIILSAEITTYGLAYKIHPTDSPWYAVPERNLFAEAAIAIEAQRAATKCGPKGESAGPKDIAQRNPA
jgi:hypothetical protein